MKRFITALFAMVAVVGMSAHAATSKDEILRKQQQYAAKLAAQPSVNLRAISGGQFQPLRVDATAANCDAATPGIVIHDDGEAENGSGWNPVANVGRYAEKFTPVVYPAKITTVCAAFITNANVASFNADIVVYNNDGANGEPGTELGRMSFVVHPDPITGVPATPAFESFDLSSLNLEIAGGSVYFSVEWDAATEPEGVFIATDESLSTPLQVGYSSADGAPWEPIGGNYRALFIRPVLPVGDPGAPAVAKSFAPAQILVSETSTLTITLHNDSQPSAAVLSSDLVDSLPVGVEVAATPNTATTCTNGTVTAPAAGTSVTLGSGAEIPAQDSCTVTVDVTSNADGSYQNVIPVDALQTQHGNNSVAASADLKVGYVFPAPYCDADFSFSVEPITRVVFADIDNSSAPTVDGSPALENFTSVIGHVDPGSSLSMAVEGNTNGDYTSVIKVYIDWNQNGVFDAGEGTLIGDITNSDGTDNQQAASNIAVPQDALPGPTRMRVTKKFNSAAEACSAASFGQAEDYTVEVSAPDPSPRVEKTFSPAMVFANDVSTLTITLSNDLNTGDATLLADLTDTFPAGLVVAATPNDSTTCASGTVTATPGSGLVVLSSGAVIPGEGTCTVQVDVASATDAVYDNLIPAGALQTDLGNSPFDAEASLQVGYVFPQPYCELDFTSSVEPITRVVFDGIDNSSDATVGGSPALEDFTSIIGSVRAGRTVSMAVEGNTDGGYTSVVKVYIDWNQNDTFDADEGILIGDFADSDGTDGQQAVRDIQVPLGAMTGTTRMRVTKKFLSAAEACGSSTYGQAEDYTLQVAPARPKVSKSFAPETVQVGEPSTATITLSNLTANDATLASALVDTFPAGVTVSDVATDCGLVVNGSASNVSFTAAAGQVSLPAGIVLPAGSSCDITAQVQAAAAGIYVNQIPAGSLETDQGNNAEDAEATLTVIDSPTVTKAFMPSTVHRTQDSTAVITLTNPSATDATLTAPLVDNLPAGLIATGATTTCVAAASNITSATAANSSVSLPAGAVIPANGSCTLSITVHSDNLGSFVNEIPEGALQTDQGDNFAPASATLVVDALASDPVISSAPGSLDAAQNSNAVTTQTLTIGNTGGSDLTWSAVEAEARKGASASGYGVASGSGGANAALNLRDVWNGPLSASSTNAVSAANCDIGTPDIIIHDDGEVDNGYGWNPVANVGRYADPFTPAVYPSHITTACLAFITNAGVTEFNFDVVVYAADGPGGAPGTELGRKSFVGHPEPIAGLPTTPSFESFDLSGLGVTINSGSVYISAEWDAAVEPEGVYLASDESASTPATGGYTGSNGDPWAPITDNSPDYRALFIRAVMPAGAGACTATNLPWLSVAPSSGTTAPGDSSSVTVTFDSTNLATGTYTGKLCVSSNDPVNPLVQVPVSMTVDANDPAATVTPGSLSLSTDADTPVSATLDIANASGSDPLTFSIMARGSNNAQFRLQPSDRAIKRAAERFATHPPSLAASNTGAAPSVQQAPWLPQASLDGQPLVFMHDDGSAETAIGWGVAADPEDPGSVASESMAVWINRFAPPADTGAYTITTVSILWPGPDMSGGSMVGLEANLVFYYDFDGDGDPGNAFRLGGDTLVTIGAQGEFENYPVSISVPGDGDIYIGFADQWAEAGGYTPRLFPAALDETNSMEMSYLSGNSEGITDLDNLANNDTSGVLEDLGLAGNWMIRAVGSTGTSCVGPVIDWLSAAPASGSVDAADSTQVTVTADPTAAGLGAGTYHADLCITTNDPAQSTIAIPVTLEVTPGEGIFCDGFEIGGDGSCNLSAPPPPANGIVASGPVNIELPASFDGVYVNWLTGATCSGSNTCGGQFNAYTNHDGELSFLWPRRDPSSAGMSNASGKFYAVLQSGATIGKSAQWLTSTGADFKNWNSGVDGYLGFAFQCPAAASAAPTTCYGYAHIVTGSNGQGSRLLQYWYDASGASITIP